MTLSPSAKNILSSLALADVGKDSGPFGKRNTQPGYSVIRRLEGATYPVVAAILHMIYYSEKEIINAAKQGYGFSSSSPCDNLSYWFHSSLTRKSWPKSTSVFPSVVEGKSVMLLDPNITELKGAFYASPGSVDKMEKVLEELAVENPTMEHVIAILQTMEI